MTGTARHGAAIFKPRARLLRLLGAELISDDVVAVTELVKNAHDADAAKVRISFSGVTGADGTIVIEDDGCGMDLETLIGKWMEPASSWKSLVPDRRTPGGRRYLGEKGVGRFATDKLASRLEIISRRAGERTELHAAFDWDEFDHDDRMLSDVTSRWEVCQATTIAGHGTVFRLSGLRSRWTERSFRRLSTRLARLRPPFGGGGSMAIAIDSDEFPSYMEEGGTGFLDRAPYRIDARFDGDQIIEFSFDHGRVSRQPWSGQGELRCGPVNLRIHAFDLETEALSRVGPRNETRAWLREWSGISVYRDGFRVWPYGEPHDDWLRLDQRRVNNPVVRLSNNQVVGFVEISGNGNPDLRDQTNREGLIHTPAFDDLKRLVHFVLQVLEAERQSRRHPAGRAVAEESPMAPGQDAFSDLMEKLISAAGSGNARLVRQIARTIEENRRSDREMVQDRLQGYAELAATGHTVAGLHAAVGPLLERTHTLARELERSLDGHRTRKVEDILERISRSLEIATKRMNGFPSVGSADSQRRRIVDIGEEIKTWGDHLRSVTEGAGIDLEIHVPPRAALRSELRPSSLGRLLDILAMNSLVWLHGAPRARIRVVAQARTGICEILFSDNGPGIPDAIAERVFEPRFTTREGGLGMGLTIARDLVELHGGSIHVVRDARRTGATVRIHLPKRRSRATITA